MTRLNPILLALLAGTTAHASEAPQPEAVRREIEVRVATAMATAEREMARAEKEMGRAEKEAGRAMERAREAERRAIFIETDGFAGHELGRERVVKGAPYCAEAVHETVQALADGNRIVKKQSTQLCRDGEGRTRREVLDSGGGKLVYLRDPVAKQSWVLNPETKSVRRLGGAMAWHSEGHSEAWREWSREFSQRMRESFKDLPHAPVAPRPPEAPRAPNVSVTPVTPRAAPVARGEPALVVETEVLIKQGDGEPQRQRDRRVIRLSELPAGTHMAPLPPMPPLPPLPPALGGVNGWSFSHFAPRGEPVLTALPPKEIEGVKVTGERSTWTIEAGKIGNEKPILITREVWTSPELMLTVLSRDTDPRSGEVNYRLQNIKRGEPDAALMKLPADYTAPTPRAPRAPEPGKKGG